MIQLYVADITQLPNPEKCPELLKGLPSERITKIRSARQEDHKKQMLGAGLLLQRVLALCFDGGDCNFKYSVGEHGKPKVEGLEYNLSHSGNFVICAVSDKPIGCDVEKIRKAPKEIAERFFAEGEKQYLARASVEQYDEEFFRIWTMKESFVKMTGEGLSLSMATYEIVMGERGQVLRDGRLQECYITEFAVDGYRIAVCSEKAGSVETIRVELN